MSEVAFEVYSQNGSLQATGEGGFGYGLSAYGALTLVDDKMTHPQPMVVGTVTVSGTNPILAFKAHAQINVERVAVSGSNFTFHLRCQSRVPIGLQYWVFDTTGRTLKDTSMNDVEFALYDATGVKTFDAAMAALVVVDARETAPASTEIPFGSSNIANGSSVTVPSGRTYAVIQSTPAFIPTQYDTGAYSSDVNPPSMSFPDDSEPGPGMRWRYQNLEYYHSTGGYTASNTIYVGITQFERWSQWYAKSYTPHIEINGQCRHLIVDVTDFPSEAVPNPATVNVSVNATTREVRVTSGSAATSTTPTATVTASGGTSPYTYDWYRDSGSTAVVANGATDGTSLSTRVTGQQPGTTVEAKWICRVTDRNGGVGYSQPVTFRHIVEAADTTPDPLNFSEITINTNSNSGSGASISQITGINQPITLRVERYEYSGNLSSCIVNVSRSTSASGPWTHLGSFDVLGSSYRYYDAKDINNGDYLRYEVVATTDELRRTATFKVSIWNLTGGQFSLGGKAVSVTVDADNNYQPYDYQPDPISLPNLTLNTNEHEGYTNTGQFTITGINRPIVLRFHRDSQWDSGGVFTRRLFIEHSSNGGASWTEYFIGAGALNSTEITVNNGDRIRMSAFVDTQKGRGQTSFNVYVTNLTRGEQIASCTVSATVDADDNYNYNYAPNAVDWGNISVNSTGMTAMGTNAARTISGIDKPINIRATMSNVSNTLDASSSWSMYVNNARVYGSTIGNGHWVGYNVNPNDSVYFRLDAVAGVDAPRSLGASVTVTNQTLGGAVLDTFSINANVRQDDLTPDTITFPTQSWSTTNSATYGAYSSLGPNISGVNKPIRLRFEIISVTNNLSSSAWAVTDIQGSTHTNYVTGRPMTVGTSSEFTVNNGSNLTFKMDGSTTSGRRSASGTVRVTNVSTGAVLGTFNFSVTVDSNDVHNKNTPDPIDWADLSLTTNEASGTTSGSFKQVKGITVPITLRVQISGATGNLTTWRQNIHYNPPGAASSGGPWTNTSVTGNGNYLDFTITNNQWIYFDSHATTSSGRRTGSWTTTVTNLTTGQVIDTFKSTMIVDNDNNHNIAPPLSVSLKGSFFDRHFFTNAGVNYTASSDYGAIELIVNGGEGTKTIRWEPYGGGNFPMGWSYTGDLKPSFIYTGRTNYTANLMARAVVTDQKGVTVYSDWVYINLSAGNEFN